MSMMKQSGVHRSAMKAKISLNHEWDYEADRQSNTRKDVQKRVKSRRAAQLTSHELQCILNNAINCPALAHAML